MRVTDEAEMADTSQSENETSAVFGFASLFIAHKGHAI